METKRILEIFDSPVVSRIECIIIGALRFYTKTYGMEIGGHAIRDLLMMRQCILNNLFVLDEQNIELLIKFNESLKRQVIEARERCITLINASVSSAFGDSEVQCDIMAGTYYPKAHPVQTNRAKKIWAILCGDVGRHFIFKQEHVWCIEFNKSFFLSENDLLYCESLQIPDCYRFDDIELELNKYTKITEQFHKFYSQLSLFDLLWLREFRTEINVQIKYKNYKEERII